MLDQNPPFDICSVVQSAEASKFGRFIMRPMRYLEAILYRELIYSRNKKEKEVIAETFFGVPMHIFLPSSTDIYLTGGKSHDSEIRLARFLMSQLHSGYIFLDIGAHYGYFSLLAAQLVGDAGQVYSFEASPKTFRLLEQNTADYAQMHSYNLAVSDTSGDMVFYEFPNLYSEYNSMEIEQYMEEPWYKASPPEEIHVESIVMDDFLEERNLVPNLIKIDVEGAEYHVIKGMQRTLEAHAPVVVMEYLSDDRSNVGHKKAEQFLQSIGYRSFFIQPDGSLETIRSISDYLESKGLESDNIVFTRFD